MDVITRQGFYGRYDISFKIIPYISHFIDAHVLVSINPIVIIEWRM